MRSVARTATSIRRGNANGAERHSNRGNVINSFAMNPARSLTIPDLLVSLACLGELSRNGPEISSFLTPGISNNVRFPFSHH